MAGTTTISWTRICDHILPSTFPKTFVFQPSPMSSHHTCTQGLMTLFEAMMSAYPCHHELDYDEPDCPATIINLMTWKFYHVQHYINGWITTSIADNYYFKALTHMLRTGYHAVLSPGETLSATDIHGHVPAYLNFLSMTIILFIRLSLIIQNLIRRPRLK